MKKIYTNEQKDEFLKMYWSGESVASISASTGVAKSTLYKWIREAPPKKAKPVNMTDFRILKQRCETLEKIGRDPSNIALHGQCALARQIRGHQGSVRHLLYHVAM